MVSFTDEQLGILFKLWRRTCFGRGHMLIDTLVSGFPSHLKGQMRGEVDDLIRKNILIPKPTKHGHAVHINLDNKNKIEKALKNKFPFL